MYINTLANYVLVINTTAGGLLPPTVDPHRLDITLGSVNWKVCVKLESDQNLKEAPTS